MGRRQGGAEGARQVRDLGEGSLPGHRRGRQEARPWIRQGLEQ